MRYFYFASHTNTILNFLDNIFNEYYLLDYQAISSGLCSTICKCCILHSLPVCFQIAAFISTCDHSASAGINCLCASEGISFLPHQCRTSVLVTLFDCLFVSSAIVDGRS